MEIRQYISLQELLDNMGRFVRDNPGTNLLSVDDPARRIVGFYEPILLVRWEIALSDIKRRDLAFSGAGDFVTMDGRSRIAKEYSQMSPFLRRRSRYEIIAFDEEPL